ncbi:hypothetical protein E8E12_003153 [Didymella heteroderae]|uniref:Heterokaryon incompatibility domain-containing protein n=1 Tax=Didymella heteroderae TaxID=1769908 RepID=A0A9P4WSA2_9PLEO|nr:hypothetical protein E8E12_003153 [Didymella heteroderae]
MQHYRDFLAALSQYCCSTTAVLSQYYYSTIEVLSLKTRLSEATYRYDELPEHAFRYLVLHPGASNEPLVCTLRTSNVNNAEYEAISYVWGSEVQEHDIICDGTILKITSNLNEVLRQVRRAEGARNLWVDSICINQKDLKEKGHQVAMMGEIYRAATCVLICIGSAGSECAPGLKILAEAASRMIDKALYHTIYGMRIDPSTESHPLRDLESDSEPTFHHNGQDPGIDFDYRSAVERCLDIPRWNIFPFVEEEDVFLRGPEWNLMNTFGQNEWFDRGWVVREASLARKAVVIWGDTELLWDDLNRISLWTGRRAKKDLDMTQAVRIRCHFEAYRTRYRNFSSVFFQEVDWFEPSLLDYMGFARTLRLKDPRDRIYAFLDLGPKLVQGLAIVPNYTDTPLKVFQDFATNYILTTKDMNLLYHVMHDEATVETESMTWVPRWDSGPENMVHFVSSSAYSPLRSRTGQISKPTISANHVLRVQGLIFDTVCFTSNILTGSYSTSSNVPLTIGCSSLTKMFFAVWLQR